MHSIEKTFKSFPHKEINQNFISSITKTTICFKKTNFVNLKIHSFSQKRTFMTEEDLAKLATNIYDLKPNQDLKPHIKATKDLLKHAAKGQIEQTLKQLPLTLASGDFFKAVELCEEVVRLKKSIQDNDPNNSSPTNQQITQNSDLITRNPFLSAVVKN